MEFNEVENLSDTQILELYREVVDGPSNLLAYYVSEWCSGGYVHRDVTENGVSYGYDTGIPCGDGYWGYYTSDSCNCQYGTIWKNVNENGVAYSYNTGTPCQSNGCGGAK